LSALTGNEDVVSFCEGGKSYVGILHRLIQTSKDGFRRQLKNASVRLLLKKNEEEKETTSHNYGFVPLIEICSIVHYNVR
jgi:hypothetical protein